MFKSLKPQPNSKFDNHWLQRWWRPLMAIQYMIVCLFDFLIAPILWTLVQIYFEGAANQQWMPITLQGAGLYHLAMGAVLGIAAYGRTQEKLTGSSGWPAVPAYQNSQSEVTHYPKSTNYGMGPSQYSPPMTNSHGQRLVPQSPEPLL